MKKKVLFYISLLSGIFFVSCKNSGWYSDFDKAKAAAEKQKKDIYLLFTADDLDAENRLFKENIVNTKEFSKKYGSEFIFVNIDFSVNESSTINDPESASESEKNPAEVKALYEKKEALIRHYSVNEWPSAYIVSYEGYVLAPVGSERTVENTEEYFKIMDEANIRASDMELLVGSVRDSDGLEKAKAVDRLVKNTETENIFLLKDLILEFPALDSQNITGLLGDYEIQGSYYRSLEALEKGEDPSKPFVEVSQKSCLSEAQRQEALYMAAYTLVSLPEIDFERVQQYLTEAYEINTESEYSVSVLEALESVRKFLLLKDSQETQN